MINCEIELHLSWSEDCVLIEQNNNITGVNFVITSTKLYVPVVTLSINDIKFLENIKQGFKKQFLGTNIDLKKQHNQKNNNLDYLIDPTFTNNTLFVLSFKNGNNDPTRNSFDKYCIPLVEIKDFNVLVDKNYFLISQ